MLSQGREGRTLKQAGTLVADSPAQLFEQIVAIELYLDGQPQQLIDEAGNAWDDVVMIEFDLGDMRPVGPRIKADYRITYVQTLP